MAKGPAWKYTREDEAGLLYLALAAREHCGQQQSPANVETESEDDFRDDEGMPGPANHDGPEQSATVSSEAPTSAHAPHDLMKRQFLDNFAELLSRRKDPSYVSSCALVESGKKVKIFVARNAGFEHQSNAANSNRQASVDSSFFDAFRQQALDLRRGYTTTSAEALYELLVEYYRTRLSYHIKEFCSIPTRPDDCVAQFSSSLQLKRSRQFFGLRNSLKSLMDAGLESNSLRKLATAAYKLSRTAEFETVMYSVFHEKQSDRALRQLRFVARIRAIFLSVLETIRTAPSFQKIDIIPIPKTQPYTVSSMGIGSARESATQLLRRYLDSIPEFFNRSDFAAKLEEAFYGQSLIVHAEVQTALFFDANKEYSPFPYIGISKKSCHLCSVFLANFRLADPRAFGTRPSHSHLHPFWSLPVGLQVRKQRLHSPAMALAAVQQNLTELLGKNKVTKLNPIPQSTIVRSARPVVSSGPVSVISALTSGVPKREKIDGNLPPHVMQAIIRVRDCSSPVNGPTATLSTPEVAASKSSSISKHDSPGNLARVRLGLIAGLLQIHRRELPQDVKNVLPLLRQDV